MNDNEREVCFSVAQKSTNKPYHGSGTREATAEKEKKDKRTKKNRPSFGRRREASISADSVAGMKIKGCSLD